MSCSPTAPPLPRSDIDSGGKSLVSFLLYLHDTYGVVNVTVIAHSMGGIFSRAAMKVLRDRDYPVHVRSLSTLGSPWYQGTWFGDITWSSLGFPGLLTFNDLQNDTETLELYSALKGLVPNNGPLGPSPYKEIFGAVGPFLETSTPYLQSWSNDCAGVLDNVDVNIVGGGYFKAPNPETANVTVFPHDGIPSLYSTLAVGIPESVLPRASLRLNLTFMDNVHSPFIARAYNLSYDKGEQRGGAGGGGVRASEALVTVSTQNPSTQTVWVVVLPCLRYAPTLTRTHF